MPLWKLNSQVNKWKMAHVVQIQIYAKLFKIQRINPLMAFFLGCSFPDHALSASWLYLELIFQQSGSLKVLFYANLPRTRKFAQEFISFQCIFWPFSIVFASAGQVVNDLISLGLSQLFCPNSRSGWAFSTLGSLPLSEQRLDYPTKRSSRTKSTWSDCQVHKDAFASATVQSQ